MKRSSRTILTFFGIPIGILILLFVGLVGWYTYQLTAGDVESRLDLVATYDPEAFSALSNQSHNFTTIDHIEEYIRAFNPSIGAPDAPITIIAFIDFECPYCRRSFATFESIRETYGPVVRVIFKHFPLEVIHPSAGVAGIAAQCAHQQNAFWEYYQHIFTASDVSDQALTTYASALGLNMSTFAQCQTGPSARGHVQQDLSDGTAIGVRGTPTYIVNGTMYEGVLSTEAWDHIILRELN